MFKSYHSYFILKVTNGLEDTNIFHRILNTLAVDDDFSLKSDILDRTYLYRFAVRKDSLLSHQENSDYFQSTKDESYNHSRIRVNCTAKDYYLPGLYMIGYGKGKII